MNETQLRHWVCEIGRRLHARGLTAATDGNISVRLDGERFLCTPSGVSKGFMRSDDIVIADHRGKKVSGNGFVTSEFFTHLAAYEARPDIQAVIHAHPVHATVLTVMNVDTMAPVLPEMVMGLGALPRAPYATPASREGAEVIRALIARYDAVLLDRHGAVTVGVDLQEAYLRMECVEHTARTLYLAAALGAPEPLCDEAVRKLKAIAERGNAAAT